MVTIVFRSIVAIVVGFVATFALSYGTDFVLQGMGILPREGFNVAWPIVASVLSYRTVYNVLGCFILARLAPRRPMAHALAIGAFGCLMGIIATIATWNSGLGPHWYSIALAALSLPSAWLGARFAETRMKYGESPA